MLSEDSVPWPHMLGQHILRTGTKEKVEKNGRRGTKEKREKHKRRVFGRIESPNTAKLEVNYLLQIGHHLLFSPAAISV